MFVITAMFGRTMRESRVISPKSLMPISNTAACASSGVSSIISGRLTSLLKFMRFLWVRRRRLSTAQIISLAVVLPTLPVMPTTGISKSPRYHAASRATPLKVESTAMQGVSPSPLRLALGEAAGRAAAQAIRHEVVPVHARAAIGHKERALARRAAVAGREADLIFQRRLVAEILAARRAQRRPRS